MSKVNSTTEYAGVTCNLYTTRDDWNDVPTRDLRKWCNEWELEYSNLENRVANNPSWADDASRDELLDAIYETYQKCNLQVEVPMARFVGMVVYHWQMLKAIKGDNFATDQEFNAMMEDKFANIAPGTCAWDMLTKEFDGTHTNGWKFEDFCPDHKKQVVSLWFVR